MQERYLELKSFTLVANSEHPSVEFFFDAIIRPLPSTIKKSKVAPACYVDYLFLHASRASGILPLSFNTYHEKHHAPGFEEL